MQSFRSALSLLQRILNLSGLAMVVCRLSSKGLWMLAATFWSAHPRHDEWASIVGSQGQASNARTALDVAELTSRQAAWVHT